MNPEDLDLSTKREILACAIRAAKIGGDVIRAGAQRRDELLIEHKRLNDLVSEIDRQSEKEIVAEILKNYPTHAIRAEEGSVNLSKQASDFCWIIDPLDGTTNFLHGFAHYAVSIAVQYRGQTIVAVVYDPIKMQLFEAVEGAGSQLNGKPIHVSVRSGLKEALVSTGLPYPSATDAPEYFAILHEIWQGCRNVRRPGAAALDLAYIAAGFLDGFFEFALLPWDIAAGALLVTEAGGAVSDLHGESDYLDHGYIVAGSKNVHAEILSAVQAAKTPAAWYRASSKSQDT